MVRITDLAGNQSPIVTDLDGVTEICGLGENDLEYILNTLAESQIAYIGEWQFEEAAVELDIDYFNHNRRAVTR